MRFKYYYLLLVLLIVFGTLYIVGTVNSVPFLDTEIKSAISLAKDLWGSLFATLIAVLIIDRIVKRSELQKKVSTLKHVKESVLNAFINLIWGMRPPEDWQECLKEPNSKWNDFLNRVWNLRENTSHSLNTLLVWHSDLMDEQLATDIIEMINLLDDPIWVMTDPSLRRERDIMDISTIAGETTVVITQAKDKIKRNKLLDYSTLRVMQWNEGEPPKIIQQIRTKVNIDSLTKNQYSMYEAILNDSIKFRDASQDVWIKKKKK